MAFISPKGLLKHFLLLMYFILTGTILIISIECPRKKRVYKIECRGTFMGAKYTKKFYIASFFKNIDLVNDISKKLERFGFIGT